MVFGGLVFESTPEEEKGVAVVDPGPDWRSKMTFGLKLSSLFVIEASFSSGKLTLEDKCVTVITFVVRELIFSSENPTFEDKCRTVVVFFARDPIFSS